MLSNFIQLVNRWIHKHKNEIILAAIVFLLAAFCFALGYITAKYQERQPIKFLENGQSK